MSGCRLVLREVFPALFDLLKWNLKGEGTGNSLVRKPPKWGSNHSKWGFHMIAWPDMNQICWSIDWFIGKIYRKLRFLYGIRYPNVWETIGFLSILASFNSGNVVGSNPTCAGFKSPPHLYSGACLVAVFSLFQTQGKKGRLASQLPKVAQLANWWQHQAKNSYVQVWTVYIR